MALTHISLFAGIDGFGLGFERSGIRTIARVENNPFKVKVLRQHYPDDLLIEDIHEAGAHNLPYADIISFGSPCQDLSIAGKREGLHGNKSKLFFEAIRIVRELRPAFAVWENVSDAISSNNGRDFALVLAAFQECGARDIAWRTLDAQYAGVPQRRRRIFIVADFRAERSAKILFESASVYGSFEPGIEEGESTAIPTVAGTLSGSGAGTARTGNARNEADMLIVTNTLTQPYFSIQRSDEYKAASVASTLALRQYKSATDLIAFSAGQSEKAGSIGASNRLSPTLKGASSGTNQVPAIALHAASGEDISPSLTSEGHDGGEDGRGRHAFVLHVFDPNAGDDSKWANRKTGGRKAFIRAGEYSGALSADGNVDAIARQGGVRRLTPTECERLQGFPDGWTAGQSDSTRYRQLGNAVCVNVSEWIGWRISMFAA